MGREAEQELERLRREFAAMRGKVLRLGTRRPPSVRTQRRLRERLDSLREELTELRREARGRP
jgi:hypothetical protein